jgi:hypothetical protein
MPDYAQKHICLRKNISRSSNWLKNIEAVLTRRDYDKGAWKS